MRHSPGPWRYSDEDVVDCHGNKVAVRPPVATDGEWLTDARLIADAPKLLQALRAMCRAWRGEPGNAACDDSEALIRRTEDEPPLQQPDSPSHREQRNDRAGEEQQAPDLGDLGVTRERVGEQAHEGDQQRNDCDQHDTKVRG